MREVNSPRNKKLADLTLGEIIDELSRTGGKLLNKLALYGFLYLVMVWFFKFIGWWR
jgi:hypothetical protein